MPKTATPQPTETKSGIAVLDDPLSEVEESPISEFERLTNQYCPDDVSEEPGEPEADARGRSERIAGAMVKLQQQISLHHENKAPWPENSLLDAVEQLLIETASSPSENWEPGTWDFLQAICGIAEEIYARGSDWRTVDRPFANTFWNILNSICDLRDDVTSPPPPKPPKVVPLESLEELIEQKVSPAGIANIFDWLLPDGFPDLLKVKAAKAGDVEVPTHVTLPAQASGPIRCPGLQLVDLLREQFLERRKRDNE